MEKTSDTFKQVVIGIVIILAAGWIGYISLKGVTLDSMIANNSMDIAVLKSVTSTIKDDITEIKVLLKEVRDEQRKRR